MRILHLGKFYPPVPGGMERFLGDLAEAQRAAGHDVSVLVHGQADPGDPPWLMRCPVWLRLAFAPISPAYPLWLHRAIKQHKPDLIHIHMPNLSVFWALLLPSARRLPWVVHWHSDVEVSRHKLSLRLLYPHYRIFERALLECAEAVVVTSLQYLQASAPLAPWRDKCHVVPLGVAPARLPEVASGETEGLWQGRGLRLLAIGRLTYYKGFETLIRAVGGSDGMDLVIVGEGEERSALERAIASAGNRSTVRLLGKADDATCQRLLASCDVYCLPSCERTEAFGIVLMEAMRYGKPLLASDLAGSGVTWVVRDGHNGVLVPPEDVAAWRKALLELAVDPQRCRALGGNGQLRFLNELDIADVADRVTGIYQRVLRDCGEDSIAPLAKERPLIVIPARNESVSVGAVLSQIRAEGFVDVLVVDDGSNDDTAGIAARHGAQVLSPPLGQGAWGAMQTGIRFAVRHGYPGVVTMDADGQHEPAYLAALIDAGQQADVVIGAYPERGSPMRRIAWAWFRRLTGFNLDDLTSGLRYYSPKACRLLAGEEATLMDYQDIGVLLLLRRAGLSITEIPVTMNLRGDGPSRIFSSWWVVTRYMAETTLLCLARWGVKSRES
jgi:glycosyltransferase involved in cell wall biosynthesis